MSVSTRVGTALAAGYVLGRFKKLRLALVMASALSNKQVRSSGLSLLQPMTAGLASSPEAQKLGKQITSQLVEAGKAAAMTAATQRIDKLSDTLNERSALLGEGTDEESDEDQEQPQGKAGRGAKGKRKSKGRKPAEEPEDTADEDEESEDYEESDEEPEDEAEEYDEDEESDEDEDYDEPEDEAEDYDEDYDEDEESDEPEDEAEDYEESDEDEEEEEPEDEDAVEEEPQASSNGRQRRSSRRGRAASPARSGA